ncbi:hypothetical protein MKW94_023568 [Papaver nudicaule]|uniref:Cation/H+ exchanger domain-containing protein n=1 Tax=Papaver nudicaule TaxID=74823 RepID=A0AA41W1T3_PAPNU|nr:hypothetical protein [Papaver nudicaule]
MLKNATHTNRTCIVPGKMISGGLVNAKFNNSFAFDHMPNLALQIALLSFTPRLIHKVLSRFGGVLFSPGVLGHPLLGKHRLSHYIFPEKRSQSLHTLAHFSAIFYLFTVGVKTDPRVVLKKGMLRMLFIGSCCYLGAFILGETAATRIMHEKYKYHNQIYIFSMSSFPVIVDVLNDFNILNSDLGRLAIPLAMMTDFLHSGLQVFPIFSRFGTSNEVVYINNGTIACIMLGLGIFIVFIVRPAAAWIVKHTPEGRPVKEAYISCILFSVLICGLAGEYCGTTASTAAFLLGLVIPDGPPLGTALVNKLNYLITVVFMPLQMGIVGYRTDITNTDLKFLLGGALTTIGCILGKIIGIFLSSVCLGVSVEDSLLLGLIMNLKGIVEVTLLNNWMDGRDPKDYPESDTLGVLGLVVVASVATPLLKHLYDPSKKYSTYKRRSILQSGKKGSDFRVLACVHTEDDVPAIIRLLEACNPTRLHPLSVYPLHLVELVGRASPLLIAHPRHKPLSSSNTSTSDRIVNAFHQFEHRFRNLVTVRSFTTVSPYTSMHNDICSMSVERKASFVIFPYRRQDLARPVTSTGSIKTVFQNLLRNSPCSVGVLIDSKHQLAQSTCFLPDMPYRVIVLFFGGADDREALALAMNMIHHPRVFVTVIRFYSAASSSSDEVTSDGESEHINIDFQNHFQNHKLLDDELVDHFKINAKDDKSLTYEEIEVKDGPETIWAIKSFHADFDLLVLGRQQITGSSLVNARFDIDSEVACEELGAIGEIVSSPDYGAQGSILIFHQRLDDT